MFFMASAFIIQITWFMIIYCNFSTVKTVTFVNKAYFAAVKLFYVVFVLIMKEIKKKVTYNK